MEQKEVLHIVALKIETKVSKQVFTKDWMEKNESKLKSLRGDAKRAGKILGVNEIEFMDFPDNEMDIVSTLMVTKSIENSIKDAEKELNKENLEDQKRYLFNQKIDILKSIN